MNFKKSWKRANDGFTLVELIVVIAILAILAGIAVPAYSGYIKKANKAADMQVLAAVNTAFAAAALENGNDLNEVSDATLTSEGDGMTIKAIGNIRLAKGTADVTKYNESFERYMSGSTATMKVINVSALDYVPGVGFVDPATSSNHKSYTYAGGTIYLSDADVANLVNSTFLSASTLGGSAGLLDQVNTVTGIAAGMAGSLNAVFTDPTFTQAAMNVLGVTTEEAYAAKQKEIVAALQEKNPGMTEKEAYAQLAANSAVLYAADAAVNFTDAQVNELFSTTGIDAIKANLKGGNTTEGMAQAALVYGMYTAYANSAEYGNATLQANTGNAIEVLNALENDPNFKTYVNSTQGQTDLDAYMGALGMINDSAASDPAAVEHLMVNGFNNSELKNLIASATGK